MGNSPLARLFLGLTDRLQTQIAWDGRRIVAESHNGSRGCGAVLSSGAERKVGRCDDCPPTYEEATFERLRAWRTAVAGAAREVTSLSHHH